MIDIEQLRYPIGRFNWPTNFTESEIANHIQIISKFPDKIKKETEQLNDEQLDTPYRPDGWTIRQVLHHCADSHMNAIIRFKLALTEDKPTIKPYMESLWAELPDGKNLPIIHSLQILEGVHHRLAIMLKSLSPQDLKRVFIHPEHNREISIQQNIAQYAWHGEHHLAHITELKKRNNW